MEQNLKTQIGTKLKKKLNCDKSKKKYINVTKLKNSNCDQSQKIKLWQNSKTQIVTMVIVTVVIVAVVTAVLITSFSKNNLTPRQPMKFSQCSFLRFSQCFVCIRIMSIVSNKMSFKCRTLNLSYAKVLRQLLTYMKKN